ncbi:MAG: APC family permease [Conexivisphaerales archaeon]
MRESKGLVKRVSMLDAISLNISNMFAGAALGIIGFTMIAVNVIGVNLAIASLIAFLISIPEIVVYSMMTSRVSRTGGDYVWVTRAFGGFFGSSLSLMGYTLETLAYLALITLSAVFAIGSVALFFGNTGFLGLALPGDIPGSQPLYQFLLGGVIFAILIAINILRPNAGYKLVSVLTAFGIVTLLAAIGTLLAYGHQGVVNYMNSFGDSKLTYSSVVASYKGSSFDFSNTIFMLPFFAIFVYPWLNAAPAMASEIKGKTSIKWNVPVSAVLVFALVTSAFATMYYVGGLPFVNAALNNPTLVFDYSFNFWTLAMGVTNITALQALIGLGWIVWNLSILAYGIIVFSRYVFAQAFDRFLPTRLAYISPRYGSPVNAHTMDLIITIFLVGAAAFLYGSLQSLFAAVIASMIYFVFIGLSAVVYGIRNEKGGSKAALTVAGLAMSGVFLFLISQFLGNPTVWGSSASFFGIPGYIFGYSYAAGSFIAGAIIYLASRSYHKSRGINIDLAYKEIPPD